jgi:hypothetical protein
MSAFSQIVLMMASGPGIAAPQFDRYELERGDLSEADARMIDAMLAGGRILELGDVTLPIGIRDGPHKSYLNVEMTDGRSHSVAFAGPVPAQLTNLIRFVQTHGRASEP